MDILTKFDLLKRLRKLSTLYKGTPAEHSAYQMILKSLRGLYALNKKVFLTEDINTIKRIKDRIDNHNMEVDNSNIQSYGSSVFHREKHYSGITDGTTNLKHLFEEENDEKEFRIRTSDGEIKIASPKKLDFIGVAYIHQTTRKRGYENLCHGCHKAVGPPDKRCSDCHWYICSHCGSCGCNYR